MTNSNIMDTENVMDAQIENMFQAQQERARAEEQDRLDIEIACEVAKCAFMQKRIRHLYYIGNQVCMFLSGACTILAVLFFIAQDVLFLTMSIVGIFTWFYLAHQCALRSRKKKGVNTYGNVNKAGRNN